jgi:putative oxidoreductase
MERIDLSIKEVTLPSRTSISRFHPTDGQVSIALLLFRLALGIPLLYHGSSILFGAFGGPGLRGFSAATHFPIFVALLVGLAQFAGGLAVLTGVLARLGAVSIAIVMLGAILIVHLPHGYDLSKGGFEYALALLLLSLGILSAGAGHYTLLQALPAKDDL